MLKNIKNYAMALAALAIAATSGTLMSFGKKVAEVKAQTSYYFEFMGTHGQEANPNLWTEIDQATYDDLPCNGSSEGCKIESNSVTGAAPNRRPSSVPVDANSKPTLSGPTLSASYKN